MANENEDLLFTLDESQKEIDAVFGDGFAKSNPALVGQFMVANAITFAGREISDSIYDATARMEEAASGIAGEIEEASIHVAKFMPESV